jgi:hypothetical protein
MPKLATLVLLAICAIVVAPVTAASETVTADLALESLAPPDAMTAIRTVTGARRLEVLDQHTVRVTASAADLELARIVVDLAEHPAALSDETATRQLDDGSVLTCVRLERASVPDVGTAIRKEVNVARIVMSTERTSIMLRDTPEKVASALAVVRRMEAAQE